jgi:hypothetical protein
MKLPPAESTSFALDLEHHPLFEPWVDPASGVESLILTTNVAPIQQSFYFTNSSMSHDERWLWFYCSYPPNAQRTLAVISLDPARPWVRHFPGAGFSAASPMVADPGEEPGCYFCCGASVWFQPVEGEARVICTLGDDYIRGRRLTRLATHLTTSAGGRYFLLDGEIGNHWFVGVGDRESGTVRVIKEFAINHNHAQFSPTDPDRFLIAHDHTVDPATGRNLHFDTRIWLMDVNDSIYEPLTPHRYCKPYNGISHEWWSADGRICYVDYQAGVFELDLQTRQHTHVWQRPLCHAHCDSTRRYWCADESPYRWPDEHCQVLAFDRQTGKTTQIVSAMPAPAGGRKTYHIDPHPQFSPSDRWIIYTTTVRGRAELAVTRAPHA